MDNIRIRTSDPTDEIAIPLLDALSESLVEITGNDGRHSFAEGDVLHSGSVFLIAFLGDEPVGCGGLRAISEDVCEIKRMFTKYTGLGIGRTILSTLETFAIDFGYKEIWLETRNINQNAVKFYLKQGYQIQENYGKYKGRIEAVCFTKKIV